MLKFLAASVAMMALSMSLVSGKFPPPLKEYYTGLKAMQNSPDITQSMKEIAEARSQQKMLLEQIDHETRGQVGNQANAGGQEAIVNKGDLEKKVKALEYEVAYYKAKLARSEWEKHQLESQHASNRLPAAQTISK